MDLDLLSYLIIPNPGDQQINYLLCTSSKWLMYLFGLGSPSLSSSFEGRSGTLATKSFKKSNWFSDVIHLFL